MIPPICGPGNGVEAGVGDGDTVGVREGVRVGATVGVGVGVGVGIGVKVGVGSAVGAGVSVGTIVGVIVGVGISVLVGGGEERISDNLSFTRASTVAGRLGVGSGADVGVDAGELHPRRANKPNAGSTNIRITLIAAFLAGYRGKASRTPASTGSMAPVVRDDRAEARNSTASATSSARTGTRSRLRCW